MLIGCKRVVDADASDIEKRAEEEVRDQHGIEELHIRDSAAFCIIITDIGMSGSNL